MRNPPFYISLDTVELIRENLLAVGVEVQTRKPGNYDSLNGPIAKGAFDIARIPFQSDLVGDISQSFECDQLPPGGGNFGHFCDPELDVLLREFRRTCDVREQRRLLEQEARRIAAAVPIVVIYAWTQGYAQSVNLTGFHPEAGYTPFDNIMGVDI